MINVLKLIAGNCCKPYTRLGHIGNHFSNFTHWLEFETVVGTIGLWDYLEGGTIVFLFTLDEWIESRLSDKVTLILLQSLKD